MFKFPFWSGKWAPLSFYRYPFPAVPLPSFRQDVSRLGVTCVETPDGVTPEAWEEGVGISPRGGERRTDAKHPSWQAI